LGLTFLKSIAKNGTAGNAGPNSDPPGDNDLIAAYRRSSDLRIIAQLYERYIDLLYGICLKYLGERETARDAVMDIFEELAQRLLKHEVTNFRGWLYTLARNHCLMKLRSAGRMTFHAIDPEHVQTAEELHLKDKMETEEQLRRLSKCMETLSADQKMVVQLFYLQNKCYKEIETATGMEWKKVRSHIQNGRRNLKLCMQKQETDKDPALIISNE
jgi:RNA polymerase sigma factor (sigma-70 family)